jgi:hypothetical protein
MGVDVDEPRRQDKPIEGNLGRCSPVDIGPDRDDAITLDPHVNSLCRPAGPVDDVRSSQDQIHGASIQTTYGQMIR